MPNLLGFFGPSGSGKDTCLRTSLEVLKDVERLTKATTRSPRPGEVDGTHYFFLADDEFRALIRRKCIIAARRSNFDHNLYGILTEQTKIFVGASVVVTTAHSAEELCTDAGALATFLPIQLIPVYVKCPWAIRLGRASAAGRRSELINRLDADKSSERLVSTDWCWMTTLQIDNSSSSDKTRLQIESIVKSIQSGDL